MAISHIPRSVGHNFVPEYQISAVPFNKTVASSSQIVVVADSGAIVDGGDPNNLQAGQVVIEKIDFPKITQWLQFHAPAAIKVFFNRKAAATVDSTDCIQLAEGETTYPLSIRCASLYFVSAAPDTLQIRAGLTSIPSSEFTEVVETFLGDS